MVNPGNLCFQPFLLVAVVVCMVNCLSMLLVLGIWSTLLVPHAHYNIVYIQLTLYVYVSCFCLL